LIKSVAQAITNYAMSIFKFSAGICDELAQIIRNFLWGDEDDQNKVHWMAWDKMTKPKSQGGSETYAYSIKPYWLNKLGG
jgi:hypothetical protein